VVRIRLKRFGAKNEPHWRIVVTDSKSPRDGRFIEEIGVYSGLRATDIIQFKADRLAYWIKSGAQMSETVRSLIKRAEKRAKAAK